MPRRRWECFVLILVCWLVFPGCDDSSAPADDSLYADSPYVLPYPAPRSYMCWQGRFTGGHNRGNLHYAQDFAMPVNSVVIAARGGSVFFKRDDVPEGTGSDSVVNEVIVLHSDSTYARYVHLAENGVFVEIDQLVRQGDTLAITGNTGNVGPEPHLHFDVISDHPVNGLNAQTVPVWFSNTTPHPNGVETGEYYVAREW